MPLLKLDESATLLVVDVQALTLPNARSVPAEILLARVSRIAAAFRASGRSVAYAVSTGTAEGQTDVQTGARSWPQEALTLPDEIRPSPGDRLYERAGWSAFAGTTLEADLRRRSSRQLVITGLATTFGVESTIRAAYDLGFHVVVATDAVSDPDPGSHHHSIEHTFPLLALTIPTDALLDLLVPRE